LPGLLEGRFCLHLHSTNTGLYCQCYVGIISVMRQRKYPEIDGERLRDLRVSRAITLRRLEEMSGVSFDRINKLELHGGAVRPSTIHKLAEALGVDPAELVNGGE
jgi:DNA-binding Xre family transcriptional regulator